MSFPGGFWHKGGKAKLEWRTCRQQDVYKGEKAHLVVSMPSCCWAADPLGHLNPVCPGSAGFVTGRLPLEVGNLKQEGGGALRGVGNGGPG